MAAAIAQRREELGLSIRDLAERASVSYGTIRRLQAGELTVQIDLLLQVLNVLRIDLRELIVAQVSAAASPAQVSGSFAERADREGRIPEVLQYVAEHWHSEAKPVRRKPR